MVHEVSFALKKPEPSSEKLQVAHWQCAVDERACGQPSLLPACGKQKRTLLLRVLDLREQGSNLNICRERKSSRKRKRSPKCQVPTLLNEVLEVASGLACRKSAHSRKESHQPPFLF
jgi:hypothetical protein